MRMRRGIGLALGLALGLAGASGRGQETAAARPLGSGIVPDHFDKSVRPQDDLFRHVNGAWLKSVQIAPDKSGEGAFLDLRDLSEKNLRAIIEETAAAEHPAGSEGQKIRDLYRSMLDEARADELGLKPIAGDLAAVDAVKDKAEWAALSGRLQRQGVEGLFGAFVELDAKDATRYVAYLGQGGIGLPDEAYYRDAKFAPIREAYQAHVRKMFELAGWDDPAGNAAKILDIETRLAKSHWDRVKSRDATLTYNKTARPDLDGLAKGFAWARFFEGAGLPEAKLGEVIVAQPSYFEGMAQALDAVPLDDWKTYLKWNVLRAYAPLLSKPFVDESFAFNGKTLSGTQENRPRWKRAVGAVEMALGEAVGKLYVERHFPPEAKARMQELVANLIAAYRAEIEKLPWMGAETRAKALDKLAKFTPKIGYPDKWRDYSKLVIEPGDLVGNMRRAIAFEHDRNVAKLGGPVDRGEWGMYPQTVNAYYNPTLNEIVFPAAILQPPFFNLEAEDAVNYGGIGAVIGHEIGHGFDDQGSKFDGSGNMKDWWTEADRKEFDARTGKLIGQYNQFEPVQLPGQKVNGALTIGENIGDLGGLSIALKAYGLSLKGKPAPEIDGYSGLQRVLIGWAQVWRIKYREAELAKRLATDPHSPGEFRCNGTVRNVPEFYEAFGVKAGDKLYLPPEERVRIW
jgi:predicted metalloendopeptidase